MKMLVESLKRMYQERHSHRGTDRRACHKGSISAEEYEYITGEKYSGGEAK